MVQQMEVCLQLPVKHHTKFSYGKIDAFPASGVCPVPAHTCNYLRRETPETDWGDAREMEGVRVRFLGPGGSLLSRLSASVGFSRQP